MGLFNSYFTKPGPGVEKDAPQKHRIWQFFEIFWNQMSKLSLLNMLYFIAMLPLVFGLYLCFKFDVDAPLFISLRTEGAIDIVGLSLIVISLFVSYPATVGFTFVLRNIQRREHAWIWHDFIKHIRLNYKKGVLNGVVSLLLYYFCLNAYTLYTTQQVFPSVIANSTLSVVILFIMVIFTWMQFYVNTMIVTFDLKLSQIYKNAAIFAIAKIPLNLFISIVCIALAIGILLIPIPLVLFFLAVLILYSLFGFITVFSVYPTIDKYMMPKEDDEDSEDDVSIINSESEDTNI